MNTTETETIAYYIEVQIRKRGGLIPHDSDGEKVRSITLEKRVSPLFLDTMVKRIYKDFEAITPDGADINVEVYVPNSISGTWMNMASFYGSNKRFVKH